MEFDKHLKSQRIDEAVIEKITNVDYPKDAENPKQDTANFMYAAMNKCDELLDYDTISEVMFDRACCKTGIRLNNSRAFAKEHASKTMREKLELLGDVQYYGQALFKR